MRATYLIARI